MDRPLDSTSNAVARLFLSLLFITDGVSKISHYSGLLHYLQLKGIPLIMIAAPIATTIELLGGVLVLLGLFTRPVAIILALYTLLVAFIGHRFWTIANPALRFDTTYQFWKNFGISGGFLLLSVLGAGRYSLDALVRLRKPLPNPA